MPKTRQSQVSLEATPYYHCTSRCVRRAWLCGTDALTGQSFEHRRQWIEDRLLELGDIFAIDVCAYAVMSNHYHVVLHVNAAQAKKWTIDDVIHTWHRLFAGNLLSQRYVKGETLSKAEFLTLKDIVEVWRERLMDISWFMRVINEGIARRSNAEDNCTGRFWEGRFNSQALLDEAALAACMVYVDLNPVRAGIATTPESSDHTSIQRRIRQHPKQPDRLFPFVGNLQQPMPEGLPFRFNDYLDLVDWTGRCIRDDKRGYIPNELPPILQRLNQRPRTWLFVTRHFESKLKRLVGAVDILRQVSSKLGYRRTPGLQSCKQLFSH